MTNYRWTIIGLAFIAIIITYLDRMALSYAITPLKETFGFTNSDFGIIAAAFGVGYLIMTVGGGILVDRYGARKIWTGAAIIWSVACALMGLASGFWLLFLFRLLLGVAEGPSFPALTRVVTDWLPITERARALAWALAAVPFASVVGAPFISYLIVSLGWRAAFMFLGIFGIIWAIIWVIYFRDQPQESTHVSPTELARIQQNTHPEPRLTQHSPAEQKTTWKFILLNPSLLANNCAYFSFGYLIFFSLVWLPGYLQQTFSISLKQIGFFLIAPWSTATLLIILGGFLSDWLWQKTKSIRAARSHIIWVCQVLSALCFIPILFFHSLPIAIICISLGLGIGLMPNAVFYAINADLARDRAATSQGTMNCFSAVASILAPLLTGILSTITGDFNIAFILLIVFSFASALGIFLFQHPDKKLA